MKRVEAKPEYSCLAQVFDAALVQAQAGKGLERHASGEDFSAQVICEVGRRVGMGYPLGQAVKKAFESQRLSPEAAVKELLGAINYLAAGAILRAEAADVDIADFIGIGAQINSGQQTGGSSAPELQN